MDNGFTPAVLNLGPTALGCPWIAFESSVNLDGGEKNYNFIFNSFELKFSFSCNTDFRQQSNLWPLDSKNVEVCHPRCVKSNITVYNMYVLHIYSVRNTTINRWYHYVIYLTLQ